MKKSISIPLLFLLAFTTVSAQVNVVGILSVRGTGDNMPATSVSLYIPENIATDDNGNLYISSVYDYRFRKVDTKTHIITTVAGTGIQGTKGDSGLATKAEISKAGSITINKTGDIYFADIGKIRKVDAKTGIITTVVGGGAEKIVTDGSISNSLNIGAEQIALDSANNIYFEIPGNSFIYKADIHTNIIHVITTDEKDFSVNIPSNKGYGPVNINGGIYFASPRGIYRIDCRLNKAFLYKTDTDKNYFKALFQSNGTRTFDNNFNLYSINGLKNRIEKYDAKTGESSIVAENVIPKYWGDCVLMAIAVDKDNNIFLVVRNRMYGILKIDANTKKINWYSGTGDFTNYTGWDKDGKNYVGNRIGFVDTFQHYVNKKNFTADTSGNIFYTDMYSQLKKLNPRSDSLTSFDEAMDVIEDSMRTDAKTYPHNSYNSITCDLTGNIYFIDSAKLKMVNQKTKIITTISTGFNSPFCFTMDKKGDFYVADGLKIKKLNSKTKMITTIAGNGTATDGFTQGYTGDGGPATSAQLEDCKYGNLLDFLYTDKNNNLFLQYRTYSRKVDGKTGIISTCQGKWEPEKALLMESHPPEHSQIWTIGFWISQNGLVYRLESNKSAHYTSDIRKVSLFDTSKKEYVPVMEGMKNIPTQNAGNLLKSLFVDSAGKYVVPKEDGFYSISDEPYNIIKDSAGDLWLEDKMNNRKYNANARALAPSLVKFTALASDDSGNVYASSGYAIYKLNKIENSFHLFMEGSESGANDNFSTFGTVSEMTCDHKGNIYVADGAISCIFKIDIKTKSVIKIAGNGKQGYSGDGGKADTSMLLQVRSVCVDSADNLYVLNDCGHICKIDENTNIITSIKGDNKPFIFNPNVRATDAGSCNSAIAFGINNNLYYWASAGGMGAYYSAIEKINPVTKTDTIVIGKGYSREITHYAVQIETKEKGKKKHVTNQIKAYDPNADVPDGGHADSAEISDVTSFTTDRDGNIYMGENYNRIRKTDMTTGLINTLLNKTVSDANYCCIYHLTIDNNGNIYYINSESAIQKFDSKNGSVTALSVSAPPANSIYTQCDGPISMVASADGKQVYIFYIITATLP